MARCFYMLVERFLESLLTAKHGGSACSSTKAYNERKDQAHLKHSFLLFLRESETRRGSYPEGRSLLVHHQHSDDTGLSSYWQILGVSMTRSLVVMAGWELFPLRKELNTFLCINNGYVCLCICISRRQMFMPHKILDFILCSALCFSTEIGIQHAQRTCKVFSKPLTWQNVWLLLCSKQVIKWLQMRLRWMFCHKP